MNLFTLMLLVRAEVSKLLSRTTARAGLGLLVLMAMGIVGFSLLVSSTVEVSDPSSGAADAMQFTVVGVVSTVLWFRNIFVFRFLLIALIALSVAGELAARTLREDLVRPVPRWSIYLAKAWALGLYTLMALVLPSVTAGCLAAVWFPVGEGGVDMAMAHGLTFVCDLGFGSLVILIALMSRAVSGTVVGVVLYWLAEQALGLALWGAASFRNAAGQQLEIPPWVDTVINARPYLPSSAFNLYAVWTPDAASWQEALPLESVAALMLFLALFTGAGVWRFSTMDVD